MGAPSSVSLQLEIPRPTGAAPWQEPHERERRELEELPGAGLEELVPVVGGHSRSTCTQDGVEGAGGGASPGGEGDASRVPQDCSNATCVDIVCWVPGLDKDQRALVSVRALLWMDTLQQVLALRGTGVALCPQGVPVMSTPA